MEDSLQPQNPRDPNLPSNENLPTSPTSDSDNANDNGHPSNRDSWLRKVANLLEGFPMDERSKILKLLQKHRTINRQHLFQMIREMFGFARLGIVILVVCIFIINGHGAAGMGLIYFLISGKNSKRKEKKRKD